MAKIFISYSRASKDVVKQLVQDLTDESQETWFDEHLTGGQQWWDNILSEIRECEIFVVALTPNSLESRACQREVKYAKDLQKTLLPVRLSDQVLPDSLPPGLSELQWVDYSRLDKQAFKSLQRTLKFLPKSPPLPDPLPDAPPVPISYLSSLRAKIESDSQLQLQEQIQLVFELRRRLRNGDSANEIVYLLHRLKNRDDLFASVSYDVDQLIRDIGREFPIGDRLPPPEPEPPGLDEDDEPPKPLFAAAPIPPEPLAIDQPVTPPQPAEIGQSGSLPAEPAAVEESVTLSNSSVVDVPVAPPELSVSVPPVTPADSEVPAGGSITTHSAKTKHGANVPVLLPVIVVLAIAVLGYLLYDGIKEPHSNPKPSTNSYSFEPLGGTTGIHNFGMSLKNSPDGVVVSDVDSGSNAEKKGVHLNNIIAQINNRTVTTLGDISDEIMYCASTYGSAFGISSASVNLYIKGRKTPVRLDCQ